MIKWLGQYTSLVGGEVVLGIVCSGQQAESSSYLGCLSSGTARVGDKVSQCRALLDSAKPPFGSVLSHLYCDSDSG